MEPASKPLDFPFSGEYWMYRRPASRPPRHSIIRRGSALDLAFHTTDGWPLEMEAHQKLDTAVSMACCREIQLVIRSADQHPESVSLELVLRDTVEFPRRQSLGSAVPGPPAPSPQVLRFQMRASPVIRQFDELEIVFHRGPARMDKSVHIAIDRLVLVP